MFEIKLLIILCAVLGSAYKLILEIVRYRSANNPIPENVSDVYDAETYAKWKRYSAEHCVLNIVFEALTAVSVICLLSTNAYAAFASLFPQDMALQLLAVVLLDLAVSFLFDVVKGYISTMVIEQKYGFNRSGMRTFIFDCLRDLVVGTMMTLGIAFLILALHRWVGDWMILIFAAVVFVFTMFIAFLYPLLSRVGNKFTPLEDGELKDRLMELLNKHGYKVKAIEVMDASRRTTKLNAYFTGFGKMKTIVLYDNLLNAMSTEEICAIFAHEMGHGLHKDVLKNQLLNSVYMLLMGVMVWFFVREPAFYTAFGFEEINYGFAYLLIGIGLGLLQPLVMLAVNANSRRAEYRADAQAVQEGYGREMISAFKKLAKDNFSHLAPSRINVVLEYSHPPIHARVESVECEMKKRES